MTKDEALDLALEALENLLYWDNGKPEYDEAREAITAIKQALDKKAENARELGLDYEPVREDWGPGPHEVHSLPPAAPVQRCTSCDGTGDVHDQTGEWRGTCHCEAGQAIKAKPPAQPAPASWVEMVTANLVREGVNKHKARELAEHFYSLAQRQWVSLTNEERLALEYTPQGVKRSPIQMSFATEDKLKGKNNG